MINSKPSGVLDRYRKFLPVGESTPVVSIGEGDTPLIRAYGLERRIGGAEVWLKLEGCNQRFGISHRIIDCNSRACSIDEGIDGIEVNQFRADVLQCQQIPLLAMLLKNFLHSQRECATHLSGLLPNQDTK